jgi:hypothetical protein
MLWSQLTYPTGIAFPISDEFAAVSGRWDAMAVFSVVSLNLALFDYFLGKESHAASSIVLG